MNSVGNIMKAIKYGCYLLLFFYSSMVFSLVQADLADDETLVTKDDDVAQIISDATANDILVFDAGIYSINLVIDKSLTLKGISTADVIFKSGDGDIVIDISNNTNVTIQNVTFFTTKIAIRTTSSTVTIKNNVFSLGAKNGSDASAQSGVAIQTDTFSNIIIKHNVFHDVFIAIESLGTTKVIAVSNNIFSLLSDDDNAEWFNNIFATIFSYNCFNANVADFSVGTFDIVNADLGLVDVESNDFHLKSTSVCKDVGETIVVDGVALVTDIGAYGGVEADVYAFPIKITSVNEGDSNTVDVIWEENNDYRIAAYKIYYSPDNIQGVTTLTAHSSLFSESVDSSINTVSIAELDIVITKPAVPVLLNVLPISSGKLAVTWNKVSAANNYTVNYQAPGGDVFSKPAGDTSRYEISGLSNSVSYSVWLTATNEYKYYFQVVGLIKDGDETIEGLFVNEDKVFSQSTKDKVSEASSVFVATPESVVPYPVLPNEGCFIATAAFGFYSYSQVQILRDFRDDYLLTNEVGVAFVDWYYHYGPYAAAYINEYEFLKPVVRVALYPLILASEVIAYDALLFLGLMVFYLILFIGLLVITAFIIKSFLNRDKKGMTSC